MMHDVARHRALLDALARDPALDAGGVGVTVLCGIVTLSGQVRSCGELLAARAAAW